MSPLSLAFLALAQLAPSPGAAPPPVESTVELGPTVVAPPPSEPSLGQPTAIPESVGVGDLDSAPRQESPPPTSALDSGLGSSATRPPSGSAGPPAVEATPPPADSGLADKVWRDAFAQVAVEAFGGEEQSLLDSIRSLPDAMRQAQAVKAYWSLSGAIVQYSASEREMAWLVQAREPESSYERALLQAARAAAVARQHDAQRAVMARQRDLAELSFRLREASLPWPADLPLVGPYRTNFEALFAGQVPPAGLRRIHDLLPITLDCVEAQAQAAAAADEAVLQVSEAYETGTVPLRVLLETIAAWRDQRSAFVRGVGDYNSQIADYALAVVGPAADPTMVVSTLIRRKPSPVEPSAATGNVRPTGAADPLGGESPPPVVPGNTLSPAAPAEPEPLPNAPSVLKSIRVPQ